MHILVSMKSINTHIRFYLAFALFMQFFSFSNAQTLYRISIIDSITSRAIPNVHLYVQENEKSYISNKSGCAFLPASDVLTKVELTHIAYENKSIQLIIDRDQVVQMKSRNYLLPEFTFREILPTMNDENIYIADYEFWNGELIVLGYNDGYKQSSLFFIDEFGDTLCKQKLPLKANGFDRSCSDKLMLNAGEDVYSVHNRENRVVLELDHTKAETGIYLPCLCHYSQGFVSGFYIENQLYAYVSIDAQHKLNYFRIIDNRETGNRAYSWGVSNESEKTFDFDYLRELDGKHVNYTENKPYLQESGMYENENDFFADINLSQNYDNRYLLNLYFYQHVIDKAIYVPVFQIKNKIYIFNHVDGKIEEYSKRLDMVGNTPIDYQDNSHWQRKVLLDRETQLFYTLFKKKGFYFLSQIDLQTGDLLTSKKIPATFISNIKVHNGFVYFVKKENDYLQTGKNVPRLFKVKL
jgi:hypothetical protein